MRVLWGCHTLHGATDSHQRSKRNGEKGKWGSRHWLTLHEYGSNGGLDDNASLQPSLLALATNGKNLGKSHLWNRHMTENYYSYFYTRQHFVSDEDSRCSRVLFVLGAVEWTKNERIERTRFNYLWFNSNYRRVRYAKTSVCDRFLNIPCYAALTKWLGNVLRFVNAASNQHKEAITEQRGRALKHVQLTASDVSLKY